MHADAIISYADNDTNTSRLVTVGAVRRTATASYDGSTVSAQVEAGYTIRGRADVTPLVGLQWIRQQQSGCSEQAAAALNLVVPGRTLEPLRSTAGARALYRFQAAAGVRMALQASAEWAHEFRDQQVVSARLTGDPTGATFNVSGIRIPRDSLVLGVGLAAQAKRNLRLFADLNAELNGVQRSYAVSAGLRYQW